MAGCFLLAAATPVRAQGYSLRGGTQTTQGGNVIRGQTATTATSAANQALQTSILAQRAQASLLHSVQAIQAMQAAQGAARGFATGPNGPNNLGSLPAVPDGLAVGGLVPDSGLASRGVSNPVITWVNAKTPVQTTSQGQSIVTVQQTAQQALLNWNSFNVGRNTTLSFDQSLGGANVGQWVAINKVAPNIAPSQILGSIKAQGQVYVLNQNGIVFTGSSQVNVGALVVSTLPINDNLVARGLLNNPDYQFLFSQVDLPAGTHGPTAAFTPQTSSPAPTSGMIAKGDSAGNVSVIGANGQDGDVVVQAGAQISSADTAEHVGGKVALIGPNVTNAGTINTPDGQTILAAGLQVGLVAHNVNDPTLRGLDVSVGKVSDPSYAGGAAGVAGTASNAGMVEVPRGDVTVIGQNVNQNGVIDSSTSVSLNGRVDLLANYNAIALVNGDNAFQGTSNFYPTATGAVTFGPDSQTQILPELSSTEKVVGTQLALSSLVNIEGKTIHFEDNSFLLAPSAALPPSPALPKSPVFAYDETSAILKSGVSLSAGNWLLQGDNSYALTYASGQGGQVYFESGATIDVAGSQNVSASVSENVVTGQLLGTELANSPLQRSGSLRGQKIQFDLRQVGVNADGSTWIGTPVADVSGYVGLVERTVGELTTAGGSVGINAGDAVVMKAGSNINVSGGYINYQGGNIQTTRVMQRGQIIDIANANPDFPVEGVYNGLTVGSAKWNVTQTFQNRLLGGSRYQAGYIQGANGGSVSITSPAMALDGNLYGNTVAGVQQVTPQAQLSKTYANATYLPTLTSVLGVPNFGSLNLTFEAQNGTAAPYPTISPTPPQIVFEENSSLPVTGAFGSALPPERLAEVDLSPELVRNDGFGNLTLNNKDGNIFVPSNVSLDAPVGGSIAMSAANIDVEGAISTPGGKLSFTVYDSSPYTPNVIATPAYDPTRGQFTLGAQGSLSTAGLNVDNRAIADAPGTLTQSPNGGKVSIIGNNVTLAPGAAIDVSGGTVVNSNGKISFGAGGTIDVEAGQDPNFASLLGGQLNFDPNQVKLTGYSGGTGGSLILKSPLIQIGGSALSNGDTLASGHTLWLNSIDAAGNLLHPDFFSQGGFSSFTLNSIGQAILDSSGNPTGEYIPGTLITTNTSITPEALTLVAQTKGSDIVFSIEKLPEGQRAPVSLNFGVSGAKDNFLGVLLVRGAFVMESGAVIRTDAQKTGTGGVKISANTVSVKGSIIAPGGAISITGGANSSALLLDANDATPTVFLGPQSYLSTAGTTLLTPNAFGLHTGIVLPGGSITVDGNIFADTGAVLDVSGASGVLDVSAAGSGSTPITHPTSSSAVTVATRIDSNGGSIKLIGEQALLTDATLRGGAGGPSAEGGTLSVASGIYFTSGAQTPLDPTLVVTQKSLPGFASGQFVYGNDAIGKNIVPEYGFNGLDGHTVLQTGYFAADSFNQGGFDSLVLGGSVKFSGPVTISAKRSLNIGQAGVIFADSTVNLNAPYVSLGQGFQSPAITQLLTSVFESGGGPYYMPPTNGTGNFNISAQFIDVGNLSLQGIGNANLTATNGDIRGYGTLDIAGAISLKAGQIYPTTENTFTIAAYDKNVIVASSSTGSNTVHLAAPVASQELIGSSLLGSVVTGISGDGLTVTLATNANTSISANTSVVYAAGSGNVTIAGSGSRQLPLSAGGKLNIYASNIVQGGVLRAPIGTINLGSGILGATPVDLLSGSGIAGTTPTAVIPTTQNVTLTRGSVTSVSAVDPVTGKALIIPYGVNQNGVEWDDPAGNNITLAGNTVAGSGINAIPDKTINISGANVVNQAGATIDISGGGDLFSYNFVTGTGGTHDILSSTTSFAILPGYQALTAPLYSTGDYVNSSLAIGEQIYLKASNGLPAGYYTLLPARYALLPGAFLVTPTSGTPYVASIAKATGASIVAGYQVNGFDTARSMAPSYSLFQISTPSVIAKSAQYDISFGNVYLRQSAAGANLASPLLPLDAGHLILAATQKMTIQGQVTSQATAGGLGGLVDIASPSSILVYGPNTDLSSVPSTTLALDSSGLSAFGAGSLLIGGYRQVVAGVNTVNVTTSSVTVDNAGASVVAGDRPLNGLSAPDVILVSNQALTLAPDARVEYSPASTSQPVSSIALNGNGVLLRVSGNEGDSISRTGVNPSNTNPLLTIGAGATISGPNNGTAGSLTLDSSYAIQLDPTAVLKANSVNLDSGQINIELMTPAIAPLSQGLVLSGLALNNLQTAARDLSLLSYSSIDIYGSGQIGGTAVSGQFPVASLSLHAAEIRGFSDNGGGGNVSINAQNVTIDNSPGGTSLGATVVSEGSLSINAATIHLGTNQVNVDQYADLNLNASSAIRLGGETKVIQADGTTITGQGSLIASDNITMNTPLIMADSFLSSQAAPHQTITASNGNLTVNNIGSAPSVSSLGLGGNLTLLGQSVAVNSAIDLPSGSLTVRATTGDVLIGGALNAGGTAHNFDTVTQYTSGGQVSLISDHGSVRLASGASVNVAAASGGGNAGGISVSAVNEGFTFADASMQGQGGAGGQNGSFSLDTASLSNLDLIDPLLNTNGFTLSRTIRVRSGDVAVNDVAKAWTFNLSADSGSIFVNGTVDASGATGGAINLVASNSVVLASSSMLTVAGQNFNHAGKGGSVTLEAGAETNGNFANTALNASSAAGPLVDIQTGSMIDLSVAAHTAGSAALGDLNGTLLIRAPQTTGNTDLQVAPINGTVLNASSIVVAGNQVFQATDGSIDNQEANIMANGTTFAGNTTNILNRLYQSNANGSSLQALTFVEPAAEIINPAGDLTLASNWDLSTYRFGPGVTGVVGSGTPGILTLRAAGNVVFSFGASLSDGFDPSNTSFALSANPMWTAPLLAAGESSWSYQITAGADFSAANPNLVQSTTQLQAANLGGSILVGQGAPNLPTQSTTTRTTVLVNDNFFQTIRTGIGDITMNAGKDLLLINNLATIYTAGTQTPALSGFLNPAFGTARTPQPPNYGAQFSFEGGNVAISAQGNIAHQTSSGLADSSLELPTTWLYRQGALDSSGNFVVGNTRNGTKQTAWWVDFSNFFEGVGALGGGNVTLTAGLSVNNVDAVAPTNARMPGATPNAANLVELGGGDVTVTASQNINGGVYYVERGQGTLAAGNQILTNATRAAVPAGQSQSVTATWLPTTLFLGKGGFDVSAGGDLELGPVVNPFLLPQGVNNGVINKSYFSTYSSTDSVNVSSLTGAVTLKDNASGGNGSLEDWYSKIYVAPNGQSIATLSQPWLRSAETNADPFAIVSALLPPTLKAVAFSGDVDVIGNLVLMPADRGTINLLAAGSLNGFQVNAGDSNSGVRTWGSSAINLSDANPAGLPSIVSPLATTLPNTLSGIYTSVNSLFAESGATHGLVLQTQLALHASINGNVLHANDPDPVHLFAENGNISGFTLFSGKAAQVVAGQDVTDIALYVQNINGGDISMVAAGRDIIAYDPLSPLRVQAQLPGNIFVGQTPTEPNGSTAGAPNAGDIQIGGPGTLEVLAGRNLNLGIGSNSTNGTRAGITSVGNARNPVLPFGGADIVAAAGMGPSVGLDVSQLNFTGFVNQFLAPGAATSARYLADLGGFMGRSGQSDDQIWNAFGFLGSGAQAVLALDVFYDVLRDAGRDHNDPDSPNAGTYNAGFAAIRALFPGSPGGSWPFSGDIFLTSREIKTSNGGNISLLAPGGQLTVGFDIAGNQPLDQGILTEDGGNISIFTNSSVNVGTSRIFTLHGGNVVIWATQGDIAAGNSSKTVQSAPPTRVLVDPQSGSVQTDLAGLATGGGIGVLATISGAPPADVDLIAPNGTVNAGDAGIRASGNINIAAVAVINAGNIQSGGKTTGTPTTSAPNVAGLSAASSAGAAASNSSVAQARPPVAGNNPAAQSNPPSIVTVEVIGYGGGDTD